MNVGKCVEEKWSTQGSYACVYKNNNTFTPRGMTSPYLYGGVHVYLYMWYYQHALGVLPRVETLLGI